MESTSGPDRRPAAGTAEDPILGAGVLLWRPGAMGPEFLLLRNSLHRTWGFPKGHLDLADPDPQTAALRELHEETGLELAGDDLDPEFADVSSYRPGPRWKRVVLYLGRCPDGWEPRLSAEHDQHAWLSEMDALPRLEHQELRRSLIRAAARLG